MCLMTFSKKLSRTNISCPCRVNFYFLTLCLCIISLYLCSTSCPFHQPGITFNFSFSRGLGLGPHIGYSDSLVLTYSKWASFCPSPRILENLFFYESSKLPLEHAHLCSSKRMSSSLLLLSQILQLRCSHRSSTAP